jgi:PAS domain S-box-containing protein
MKRVEAPDQQRDREPDPGSARKTTSPLVAPGEVAPDASSRTVRRELLLGDLARRMLNELEPWSLARVAVETIGRGLELDVCVLYGLRGNRLTPRTNGIYCRPEVTLPIDVAVEGAPEILRAVRRDGEIVVEDITPRRFDDALNRLARAIDARALLAIPVIYDSHVRSLLVLAVQGETRVWEREERLVAREASTIIGVAQRQAELLDEARRVSERETLIRQIGRVLRSSLGLDHVLRMAAERVGEATRSDRLLISRFETTGALLPLWRYSGLGTGGTRQASLTSAPLDLAQRLRDQLLAHHGALLVEDGWKVTGTLDAGTPTADRRLLICPIVVRGALWGLLELERRVTGWSWRESEIAFVAEVTEQLATAVHQAQLFEQVLRSKHEWESTFDGLADAVLIYDDARSVRRTNLAASNMLARSLGDLVGQACCAIGLCATKEGCAVERATRERERVTLEVVSPRSYHALHVTVDPVVGESGEIIGAVQLVRDLDNLRRTEAELRRQQHFLVNLVESANDAFFVVDLEGRLVWSNSHLTWLTGHLVSATLGEVSATLVPEEERGDFEMHFDAARVGATRRFETTIRDAKTAEERRVVMTFSPIYEEEKVVSVLGVARDVTEEKLISERSQQADKLRALGQLASGVAHDVNNDLAAILGRVQRLMRNPEYKALGPDLEVIETAALDSAQTVLRIQNFARQQADADFEAIDVNDLVRDAIEITRTRWLDDALSRGTTYKVSFVPADLPPILGDGSQLREVFVNLIINAIDAMPGGGAPRISSAGGHGEAHVRFADEGIGIPRRLRERIFEPFFSTKGASGTGMGLAVSYGIVTRHGGRIELESEVGRGTVFDIALPVTSVTPEAAPPRREVELKPLRILVVDDDDVVREVLVDILTDGNHTVVEAPAGAEGIRLLETGEFDVIFTDLSMPEMDGWAVARLVRERRPETKIVLVTGYGTSVTPPGDDAKLVDAIIGKPFEFAEISALLARLHG